MGFDGRCSSYTGKLLTLGRIFAILSEILSETCALKLWLGASSHAFLLGPCAVKTVGSSGPYHRIRDDVCSVVFNRSRS